MSKARQLAQRTNQSGRKNLIINGAMDVHQRGGTITVSNGTGYTLDRFKVGRGSSYNFNVDVSQSTTAPTDFVNSLKIDVQATATPSGGENAVLEQHIESQNLTHLNYGSSSGKYIVLSFWVRSNKTGTYTCEIYDGDNSRFVSKTYSISSADTWEKKTITFDGDTTGALDNDNANSLNVHFWLGAGSDFTGGTFNNGTWSTTTNTRVSSSQVNLADSTSNEWYITGVQLEAGTAASDFEFLPVDVNEKRCFRYFQTYTVMGTMGARNSTDVEGSFEFHTPMRAAPSASQKTAKVFRDMFAGTFTQSSPAISVIDSSSGGEFIAMGNLSGLTQGRIMCPTGGTTQFSSEL